MVCSAFLAKSFGVLFHPTVINVPECYPDVKIGVSSQKYFITSLQTLLNQKIFLNGKLILGVATGRGDVVLCVVRGGSHCRLQEPHSPHSHPCC